MNTSKKPASPLVLISPGNAESGETGSKPTKSDPKAAMDHSPATRRNAGAKGWALARLADAGAPVPPAFVIASSLCRDFLESRNGGPPAAREVLAETLRAGLEHLAGNSGRSFGEGKEPLLLSVRSSAPRELPMAQKTVVNVGMTEKLAKALAKNADLARLAWDAYRRLLYSFSVNVKGMDPEPFDTLLSEAIEREVAEGDHELDATTLETLTKGFREIIDAKGGGEWVEKPQEQLSQAVLGGFRASGTPAADAFRAAHGLEDEAGTAMVVQQMAFGTRGEGGAGSLLTRNPATGEKEHYGKFVPGGYGSDLTAGVRMPDGLSSLEKKLPDAFKELTQWAERSESLFQDAQELQFTIEDGRLNLLQAKPSSRTPRASLNIALDLVKEGVCDERQALRGIDLAAIDQLMHPILDKSGGAAPCAKALPASPGSAVGQVVFFAEHAEELAAQGIDTILVRHETTPEDIGGLAVARGIVTVHGGLTSHAAVVARGLGKCCIVGATSIEINYHVNEMTLGDEVVKRLDWISLDGNTGEIFLGQLPQIQPSVEGDLATVMKWADKHRTMGVRANADTKEDAIRSLEMGAEGIGLCRTEHMFFDLDRIPIFRRMILALDEIGRTAALADLLPFQRRDFMDLFRVMAGRPVTIRLLDPPLHEFLPRGIRSQTRMARAMNTPLEMVQRRTEALMETNPMLGHRGCRLAITYPEIYQMQVRAIAEAACIVKKEGVAVEPEIMVPLISTAQELAVLREETQALAERVMEELGETFPLHIGTMIETPRAAMCSRSIALQADFYSFGTNDLTQMGFGFSRDDSGSFLPEYLERRVLETDPFIAIDQEGIGRMVRISIEEGRAGNPNLKVGICGEHGGEPESVKFFHRLGLDYVSCSPFRLPIARMAAAQAAIEEAELNGG